jgi:Xaa-Pro aminopeptidase
VVVRTERETAFGTFLSFETVTLCPIERSLIDTSMLTDAERAWIDAYHGLVRERLEDHLEEPVRRWLQEKTAPLA